jgi:hypothetical protein
MAPVVYLFISNNAKRSGKLSKSKNLQRKGNLVQNPLKTLMGSVKEI